MTQVSEEEQAAAEGYRLHLTARMAAEPHVLAAWSEDTQHPVLRDAYRLLVGPSSARAARLAEALVTQHPHLRKKTAQAVEEVTEEATEIRFEPSRMKWLLSGRRDRLDHEALPGYEDHRAQEQEEAEQLEALLERVLRTMC